MTIQQERQDALPTDRDSRPPLMVPTPQRVGSDHPFRNAVGFLIAGALVVITFLPNHGLTPAPTPTSTPTAVVQSHHTN